MWSEIRQLPDSKSACIISADSRIAAYDNEIEWLQSTLHEKPCWLSDWVIVIVGGGVRLDPVVEEVIKTYAIVDIIVMDMTDTDLSKFSMEGTTVQLIAGQTSAVVVKGQTTTVSSHHESRKGISKMTRKIFSKTSMPNIFWAFAIALSSGLLINVSLRNVGKRMVYEAVSNVPNC
jgi:hypothetical protein